MKFPIRLSLLLLYFLFLTGCGGGSSSPPALQTQTVILASETLTAVVSGRNTISQSIDGQLVERTFLIRTPADQAGDAYPVVFFFHGEGDHGEGFLNANPDIGALIDAGEFIGIFPDGYEQQWNVSGETGADDLEFLSLMVNSLEADSRFDLNKIYGVGFSNGAGLVNKIAKQNSVFAGIAPLMNQQVLSIRDSVPLQPVSVFQLNGDNDQLVPINGGAGAAAGDNNFLSAKNSAENWALSFNCTMTPSTRTIIWGRQTVEEFTYSGCLNNKKVRYVVVERGGHNIEFGDEFNLYEVIWRFFQSTDRDSAFNLKLLSLGDSYTIGQSVCETCSFPQQLKDNLIFEYSDRDSIGLQVIAKTGWTTTNLLSAIEIENPATDFDLVTLLIGVNNQFQGKPFDVYETEFIALVDRAISSVGGDASRLIVLSIPDYAFTPFGNARNPIRTSADIDLYNNYARDYCEDNGLTYVDITDITREGLNDPELVATDGLHPSELAYSRFVERLMPIALEKLEQP